MAIWGADAPGEIIRSGSRVILEALRLKLRGASAPKNPPKTEEAPAFRRTRSAGALFFAGKGLIRR